MNDDVQLLSHVRPPGYRNPAAAGLYDLVVIGGGTAGLVCAAGAAGLGARVALVEEARLGGDCLNTGCVPSKSLLRSAQVAGLVRTAGALGVNASVAVDFTAVMARLRARRVDLAPHDSQARLSSLGVQVFFGRAAFATADSITINAGDSAPLTLRFRKAVIATGSRPRVLPIAGLHDTPFLTSDTLFDLQEQPRDMVVLGAGPVGCEMAQAFARLGTRVTLVELASHLLPREDADVGALVLASLERDGVTVRVNTVVSGVRFENGRFAVDGGEQAITADALLVATGREPRLVGLGLDAAGVQWGADGVHVDDRLRTRNRRVYAAGDVCSRYQFTHAADAMARIVIQNALFAGRRRVSRLVVPWCTFTSPEVAHVGVHAREAAMQRAETITVPLTSVDRAVIDETTAGFVRLHHARGRILGGTIVAPAAGELIGTVAMAMHGGHGMGDLASMVFPYPTVATALRQAGDQYRRSRLTPRLQKALKYYFRALR